MKSVQDDLKNRLQGMCASIMTTFGDQIGIGHVLVNLDGDSPILMVGLNRTVNGLSAPKKAEIEEHAKPYRVRFERCNRGAVSS